MDLPVLEQSQVDQYRCDGWTVAPTVMLPDEIAAINDELDQLVDHQPTSTPKGFIYGLHNQGKLSSRIAHDPRIVSRVAQIVTPGVAIHSSKLIGKQPGPESLVCHWHQDEAFYAADEVGGTVSESRMSVWIPLQDVDETNGCLRVVSGSQRWGIEAYEFAGTGHCRRRILRSDLAEELAISVPMAAGDCLFFSAFLWHSSRVNTSPQVRRAFIVSYQESTLPYSSHGETAEVLVPA